MEMQRNAICILSNKERGATVIVLVSYESRDTWLLAIVDFTSLGFHPLPRPRALPCLRAVYHLLSQPLPDFVKVESHRISLSLFLSTFIHRLVDRSIDNVSRALPKHRHATPASTGSFSRPLSSLSRRIALNLRRS